MNTPPMIIVGMAIITLAIFAASYRLAFDDPLGGSRGEGGSVWSLLQPIPGSVHNRSGHLPYLHMAAIA